MFKQILTAIQQHSVIIIHRHEKPDGDALGSQIGLKKILLSAFPEKKIYAVGDSSPFFSFIDGSSMDTVEDSVYENALAIVLDCGAAHLVSDKRYSRAAETARIDHHIYTGAFTNMETIDSTYESCCGLITEFAVQSGFKINFDAATALYTGMITDTGRFRYDSTNARSLRLASVLLEAGVNTGDLYRNLYSDTYESKILRARFTLKIKLTENRAAYIYTTKEEIAELNADPFAISRGMVGVMADMKGVSVWVNFTESEKGILCELRSDEANVNPIAVKYGGGGHKKASGATVPDYDTAMAMLKDLDALASEQTQN